MTVNRREAGTFALLAGVFGLFLYGFGGFVVLLAGTTFVLALLQEVQGLGPDVLSALRYLRSGVRVPAPMDAAAGLGVAPTGPPEEAANPVR